MEQVVRIAVYAGVVYGLLVGAMFVFQRSLMYFPDRSAVAPARAGVPDMAERQLTAADGVALVAWFKPAASAAHPTIVYFHGNGGNIALRGGRVRPFLDAGYGVLLLSYRGYGGSAGRPSEAGLYADGRAAVRFVLDTGVPARQVVLFGESLGSAVALQMASEQSPGALILEAPFTSAVDVAASAYPFVPVRWLVKDRYESIAKIGRIRVPLLIVHGERDRIVPVRYARRLFEAAAQPKKAVFLPRAGHNDLSEHGATKAELDFLAELYPG